MSKRRAGFSGLDGGVIDLIEFIHKDTQFYFSKKRPGISVTVCQGSAYDLYLTRELKNAHIVRAPSSPVVVDTFITLKLDVAAGVKQQLQADAQRLPGLRLLPGRFMVIELAMGLPKGRGEPAADTLRQFVEEMKSAGFVSDALGRHHIAGAAVAPLKIV